MKNTTNVVKTICEVGIFAALGFVFDELQGILFKGIFTSGGSIGFAMIAVLIIAYRRGLIPALFTGLIMGLLDVATSAYILHPIQLILDYIIPYALVGFAGLLKPFYDKSESRTSKILWLILGTVIGGLLKFASHYVAGVIYWSNPNGFVWGLKEMNPYLYCFIYNIAFIGPSIIITAALLVVIQITAPRLLVQKEYGEEKISTNNLFQKTISIITMVGGLFVFIFFLIKYINSFSDYPDDYYGREAYGYDFDPDSMILFVLGLFMIVLGVNSLLKSFKNVFNNVVYLGVLGLITFASLVYDIARILREYYKLNQKPDTYVVNNMYWLWFVIGLITFLSVLALFIVSLLKSKKQKESTI